MATDTDTPPATDSPALKRLKEEQAELALRVDIADKKKQLADLGLADANLPQGTITISGDTVIESVVLAYQSLNKVAAQIGDLVCAKLGARKRVLLWNQADFTMAGALDAGLSQMALLESELTSVCKQAEDALVPPAQPPAQTTTAMIALPVIGAAITSALELASLFRVDQAIAYSKIELGDRSLAVAVAGRLRDRGVEVYDTSVMPLMPTSLGEGAENRTVMKLKALLTLRSRLVGVQKQIAAKTPPLSDGLTASAAAIEAGLTAFDNLLTTLTKVDETSGTSRLALLLDAERLAKLIDANTAFLWLKAVAAGGGSRTVKRALGSGRASYSGGTVASYALYDRSGPLIDAATLSQYSGFITIDESDTPPPEALPDWYRGQARQSKADA